MQLSCHCGNISLVADKPEQLTVCNCSICSRYQALWGYYDPNSVDIAVGSKGETVYTWNDHVIEFVRCANCGCVTHYRSLAGDPDPRVAVNFRMASENEVTGIPVRYFNGKEML